MSTETQKVDVLAVMDAEIHSIYQMAAWCAVECNPQKAIDAMVEARAAVAELIDAVNYLMPRIQQTKGCICIDRMHAALARIGGAA